MHVSPDRFDIGPAERAGIDAFEEYLWHNGEVCNHCFSRVRAIGDVVHRETDVHTHELREFYERTDVGAQEYHPFSSPADRYGQCFCLECGRDLSAGDGDLPYERFCETVRNVYVYTTQHTPLDLDQRRLGREARDLKQRRDTQGRDRQMVAVAWARALETRPGTTSTESAEPGAVPMTAADSAPSQARGPCTDDRLRGDRP